MRCVSLANLPSSDYPHNGSSHIAKRPVNRNIRVLRSYLKCGRELPKRVAATLRRPSIDHVANLPYGPLLPDPCRAAMFTDRPLCKSSLGSAFRLNLRALAAARLAPRNLEPTMAVLDVSLPAAAIPRLFRHRVKGLATQFHAISFTLKKLDEPNRILRFSPDEPHSLGKCRARRFVGITVGIRAETTD